MGLQFILHSGRPEILRLSRQFESGDFRVNRVDECVHILDASRRYLSLVGVEAQQYERCVAELVDRGIDQVIASQAVASIILRNHLQLNLAL
tara:strand:+ start:3717 stop:3992 length:276 start_codon:yes stop_codon:yes gene_type:complete